MPASAITIGLAKILNAKQVILLSLGEPKSGNLKEVIEGEIDDNIPAAFLQLNNDVSAVIDLNVASTESVEVKYTGCDK